MATLFNTKISVTYPGLLKTIDNAALSATLKELTDGSGNQSGLYLNTAGDFKVTSILEWGSLKDTGTGVTITQFVTQANGIANFDNDTTIPTSAAVKDYVDTKFSQTDTLTEVLGFGNTTSGKDIVVSAGDDITFTDTSKILMGASSDFQIYHDGANSKLVDGGSGGLFIQTDLFRVLNAAGGENIIRGTENASVELFYDNSKKLETTTSGIDVTGNLVVSGTITGSGGSFLPLAGGIMTGNTLHNDNVKSIYGTASDGLEIFHDGFDSFVTDSGTGKLWLLGSTQVNIGSPSYEIGIQYIENASVNLRYDNAVKLATASTGVAITGALSTTTNVSVGANATFVDNGKAIFGAGSDLQIYHDGSHSYINEQGTGNLYLKATSLILSNSAGSNYLIGNSGGSVNMYFDGSEKFGTRTDGAKVTGNLEVTGTITGSGGSFLPLAGGTMTGNTIHNDNVKSIYGTSSDGLEVYHDGSNSFVKDTGTGDLRIQGANVSIETGGGNKYFSGASNVAKLYHTDNEKLRTSSTGIAVTGNGIFTGNVTIPDNQQLQFGNSNDLRIQHASGGTSFIQNFTGQLNIDQAAITQSIVFRVSNANANDTTALTINREGDLTTGADVTIAGNLTVNGTTTTINTQTLAVEDPLIELSKDNAANSVDIGFYGKYNDGTARYLGLFSDASDSNKFRLFKGTTIEPTTTVNIAGLGYVAADLVVAGLEATNFVSTDITIADYIYHAGDLNTFFGFASNDNFRIEAGGVNMFGVNATTVFLKHTGNTKLITTNTGVSVTGDGVFSGNVSLADNKHLSIGTDSGDPFNTNSAIRIQDSSDAHIQIKTSTTGQAGILIGDTDDDYVGGFIYSNNTNTLAITQNNVAALTISGSQNSTFGGFVTLDSGNPIFMLNENDQSADNRIWGIQSETSILKIRAFNDALTSAVDALTFTRTGNATFAAELISANSGRYFKIQNAQGNANFPTYSFQNDGNTGMLSASSDSLGFITGGATALTLDSVQDATFAGNITSTATSFLQSFNVANNSTFFNINHTGNEAWQFKCISIGSGSNDAISIGTSAGTTEFDESGQIFSHQKLDVVTAGGRLTGKSNRGYLASVHLEQEATGADGGYVRFETAPSGSTTGVERMRIDSSGNVGIGGPPETAGPTWRTLFVGNATMTARQSLSGVDSIFATNYYINSSNQDRVRTTGTSSRMFLDGDTIKFENSPSTTVGSSPTWSERMRIDTSGKVGIGTSSIPNPFSGAYSNILQVGTTSGNTRIVLTGGSTASCDLSFADSNTATDAGSTVGSISYKHSTDSMLFATANAERMRIKSNGVVTFSQGTSTETVAASINYANNNFVYFTGGTGGGSFGDDSHSTRMIAYDSDYLRFDTAGSEKMRITSGGELLIGSTSYSDGANNVGILDGLVRIGANTTSGKVAMYFTNPNGVVGAIVTSGSATAFNTSSDYRLKEDLQDFTGLDMVSKIPVYDFKWKTDESRSYGVMAHELQEVLPQAVVGKKDAEEMQSVDYSKIVPLLVKSIQELKKEIEDLKCKCKN